MKLEFQSVGLNNGEILDGEKIGELTEFIINKFSVEKLSHDEAQIILNHTKETIGEFCLVQRLDRGTQDIKKVSAISNGVREAVTSAAKMETKRAPQIIIKTNGTFSEIYVDGVKMEGVVGCRFLHNKRDGHLPILEIELNATNVTLDAQMLPALPKLYAGGYLPIAELLNSDKIPNSIIAEICKEHGIELDIS